MKFKCRLLYGVLEMTFLPGWNWTILTVLGLEVIEQTVFSI